MNADEPTIRAKYRELARTHHPDRGGDTEEFIRIRVAYEAMLADYSTAQQVAELSPKREDADDDAPDIAPARSNAPRSAPSWMYEGTVAGGANPRSRRTPMAHDWTFGWLAMATIGGAILVTFMSVVRGAPGGLGASVGQVVVYFGIIFVVSAMIAAVGAGTEVKEFVKNYYVGVALITAVLAFSTPLNKLFANPAPKPEAPLRALE
jgi:hypothetical protein